MVFLFTGGITQILHLLQTDLVNHFQITDQDVTTLADHISYCHVLTSCLCGIYLSYIDVRWPTAMSGVSQVLGYLLVAMTYENDDFRLFSIFLIIFNGLSGGFAIASVLSSARYNAATDKMGFVMMITFGGSITAKVVLMLLLKIFRLFLVGNAMFYGLAVLALINIVPAILILPTKHRHRTNSSVSARSIRPLISDKRDSIPSSDLSSNAQTTSSIPVVDVTRPHFIAATLNLFQNNRVFHLFLLGLLLMTCALERSREYDVALYRTQGLPDTVAYVLGIYTKAIGGLSRLIFAWTLVDRFEQLRLLFCVVLGASASFIFQGFALMIPHWAPLWTRVIFWTIWTTTDTFFKAGALGLASAVLVKIVSEYDYNSALGIFLFTLGIGNWLGRYISRGIVELMSTNLKECVWPVFTYVCISLACSAALFAYMRNVENARRRRHSKSSDRRITHRFI